MPVDYERAKQLLETTFKTAEADLLQGTSPKVSNLVRETCEILFKSSTQAYREVFLGCVIVRTQNKDINIHQPYIEQGQNAFSGRSLDERVINPFLHDKRIPSSLGPYLSVFRRSVQFVSETRTGLRDKKGYDAFLELLAYLKSISSDSELLHFLHYVLYKFAELRETADVPLLRLQRISLEQYDTLISGLLSTPSGGRLPVLLVVATFTTIKEFFGLDWSISWQGINVADTASGAGGDITIRSRDQTLMAVEVTERPLDRSRIIATFNSKVAPAGIEDYLFFVKLSSIAPNAKQQARQYFAQGHEMNFLEIKDWMLMSLATMGKKGRAIFNKVLIEILGSPDIPRTLKVAWNELIAKVTDNTP